MRITITLDPDVLAIIEEERRPGETLRRTINRIIRASRHQPGPSVELSIVPGELQVDISDVSGALEWSDTQPG